VHFSSRGSPDEIADYCPALFSICRSGGTAIWISGLLQAAQSQKAQSEKAPETVICFVVALLSYGQRSE
jgi:hypothetical protein